MSLITIGGSAIPTPSGYQISIMDLSKAERNANGTMIIERIATKRKLELSWSYLTASELSSLLNKVSSVFFSVTYTDAQNNTTQSGTFYVSDRVCEALDYIDGVIRYKNIKFSLIEK